jgi:hypothetical protein
MTNFSTEAKDFRTAYDIAISEYGHEDVLASVKNIVAQLGKMKMTEDAKELLRHDLASIQRAIKQGFDTSLARAMAIIAAHYYDPETTDRGTKNALAYSQKDMMNGLCYKAALAEQQAADKCDQAVARIRSERAKFDGTEISIRNLDTAIWWADRYQQQRNAAIEFQVSAEAAYHALTGETFARPKPKLAPADAGNKVDRAALNAKLARYGIALPDQTTTVELRTNGVNTSQGDADDMSMAG